jgi:hypothetical protein
MNTVIRTVALIVWWFLFVAVEYAVFTASDIWNLQTVFAYILTSAAALAWWMGNLYIWRLWHKRDDRIESPEA